MATRTLLQLRTGARQRANVENNNFITEPELTDRVNEAIQELYDLVISVYEEYFKVYSNSFNLAGGPNGNSVAILSISGVSSFYKDNTLEKDPGTSNMRLVPGLPSELERDGVGWRRYEIIGTPPMLYIYPPESANGAYRLGYTPDAPVLVADGDSLDSTLVKWYEYVEIRVAIEINRKRQKDTEAAMLAGDEQNPQPGTLAYVRRSVLSLAKNRRAMPQQVPLGRRRSSFWDYDGN